MPTTDKPSKTPPSSAKKADGIVRVRDVERDPGAILRRAAERPVRITSKLGARNFHIMTIRRGDQNDPAKAGSLAVKPVALKRHAGRILHLASGLQITLHVQATTKSPVIFFIEPGSQCLEFAAHRLGGSSRDAALLKNAIRRSQIARVATETAVKQAEARRQDEVTSLHGRIAKLERAEKKQADLAEALHHSETALQEARKAQKAAESAVRKSASENDQEVQSLKSQIVALERAMKKPTVARDPNKNAITRKHQPEPENAPSDPVENKAPESLSIVTA